MSRLDEIEARLKNATDVQALYQREGIDHRVDTGASRVVFQHAYPDIACLLKIARAAEQVANSADNLFLTMVPDTQMYALRAALKGDQP